MLRRANGGAAPKAATLRQALGEPARPLLGITTIYPERASRIDFAEIRNGNILGSRDAAVPTLGRRLDVTLNPFRNG